MLRETFRVQKLTDEGEAYRLDHAFRNASCNIHNSNVITTYENYTGHDIVVIGKDGIPIRLARSAYSNNQTKTLGVRVIHAYNFKNMDDCRHSLEILRGMCDNQVFQRTDETILVEDGLFHHVTNWNNSMRVNEGKTIIVVRSIPKHIMDREDSVYLEDIGALVVKQTCYTKYPHPDSVHHKALELYKETEAAVGIKLNGISVRIVDNDAKIGKRFALVFNSVVELPVVHDGSLANGIYAVDTTRRTENGQNYLSHYYPLDESSRLGIYKTMEEAEANGDKQLLLEIQRTALEVSKTDFSKRELDVKAAMQQQQQDFLLKEQAHKASMQELQRDLAIKEQEHKAKMQEFQTSLTIKELSFKSEMQSMQRELNAIQHQASKDKEAIEIKLSAAKVTNERLKLGGALLGFVTFAIGTFIRLKGR